MKQSAKLLFILYYLLCLYSCKDHCSPPVLAVVDSLTYVDPDSAIVILNSIKGNISNEPEYTQMYYHLLLIKARDKAYIPHTFHCALLRRA